MANTARTQQALAADPIFIARVRNALATAAWMVLEEVPPPGNYPAREAFARLVLGDLDGYTAQLAPALVVRPELMAATTSWDAEQGSVSGAVVTTATDAEIAQRLVWDWDEMSGA